MKVIARNGLAFYTGLRVTYKLPTMDKVNKLLK